MYTGNYAITTGSHNPSHFTGNATLSHHAENFIKGSHDFKVGVEYLRGFNNAAYQLYGRIQLFRQCLQPIVIRLQLYYHNYAYSYSYNHKSNGWRLSGFAQDSWKIGDRLTINPGVRWQMQRGYLPNIQSGAIFKPKSPLEFRLGLTFDVFGDHTTAIKAHYGRFHESFKTYYFDSADRTNDWVQYDVLPNGQKVEVYQDQLLYSRIPIDPNIRIPYSDQFTVGFERTLMKDASFGVTLTYREYKDFIARVNVGAQWAPATYTFRDENGQSQTIDVFKKTTPSSAGQLPDHQPSSRDGVFGYPHSEE